MQCEYCSSGISFIHIKYAYFMYRLCSHPENQKPAAFPFGGIAINFHVKHTAALRVEFPKLFL